LSFSSSSSSAGVEKNAAAVVVYSFSVGSGLAGSGLILGLAGLGLAAGATVCCFFEALYFAKKSSVSLSSSESSSKPCRRVLIRPEAATGLVVAAGLAGSGTLTLTDTSATGCFNACYAGAVSATGTGGALAKYDAVSSTSPPKRALAVVFCPFASPVAYLAPKTPEVASNSSESES